MAEIRSTMDIIMEKTKGLTMTDEEKEQMRREEMAGKVQGLIRRFLDGFLSPKQLKQAVKAVEKGNPELCRRMLFDETKKKIEPGKDNTPLLRILENGAGMDTQPVLTLLSKIEKALEGERSEQLKRLSDRLEGQGISGSAVVPNLNADPEWKARIQEIREGFQGKVAEAYP